MFTPPSYTIQGASYGDVGASYGDVGAAFTAVDTRLSKLQASIDAIPAGPQGPQGPQGPEGPQGPAGPGGGSELAVEYDDTGGATVTLEGADGTVLSNVADGVAAGDAVNKGQLDAGAAGTLQTARTYADHTATVALDSARAYADSVFASFQDDFDTFRDSVDRRLQRQDRRIDQIAAMSGAYAGMAMNTAGLAGRNRVGVGVGSQGGESALAVGYQRALGNRASVSLGAAFGGNESSLMGGAGFSW